MLLKNGQKQTCLDEKVISIYRARWEEGDAKEIRENAIIHAGILAGHGLLNDACKIYERLLAIDPGDKETINILSRLKEGLN